MWREAARVRCRGIVMSQHRISQKSPNVQLHVHRLLYHNKKFKKKIANRSFPDTGMGRCYVHTWRRGVGMFHRDPMLVSTPGLRLLCEFETRYEALTL